MCRGVINPDGRTVPGSSNPAHGQQWRTAVNPAFFEVYIVAGSAATSFTADCTARSKCTDRLTN